MYLSSSLPPFPSCLHPSHTSMSNYLKTRRLKCINLVQVNCNGHLSSINDHQILYIIYCHYKRVSPIVISVSSFVLSWCIHYNVCIFAQSVHYITVRWGKRECECECECECEWKNIYKLCKHICCLYEK